MVGAMPEGWIWAGEAQRLIPLVVYKGGETRGLESQEEAGTMVQAGRDSKGRDSGHGDGNEQMVQEMFLM